MFIGVHHNEIEIDIFYGVHPNKAKFSLGCRNPIGAWPSPWPGDCKYTLNRCFNGGISRWLLPIFRPFLATFKKKQTFIGHLTLEEVKKNKNLICPPPKVPKNGWKMNILQNDLKIRDLRLMNYKNEYKRYYVH